ncbi:MAG: SH3 domain-containing protein [Anaerolineae bacterium]|nr:SH3 domain-containing protein [Anaerolineae bacterium]
MKSNRRRLLVFLLVTTLLLAATAVASAQGEEGLTASVVRYLYLRVLPDVKAPDFGRVEPMTPVLLLARTADSEWVQVQLEDGTTGWGRVNAVVADGEIASLPVVSIDRNSAAVVNFLTLREAPQIDANSVARLEKGALLSLVAEADGYVYAVAEDGTAGWAVPRGLQFTRASGADEPAMPELPQVNAAVNGFANTRVLPEMAAHSYERLDPGTPVNVIGRNADGDWFQVETLDGQIAWATARAFTFMEDAAALEVTAPVEGQGVVTRFAVLRQEPDSSAPEVATLKAGSVAEVLMATADRIFVETADGLRGWAVNSAFAFPGGFVPDVLAANATVSADVSVNLRAEPSLEGALRGAAQPGERLSVTGVDASGEWYRVVPASRVGAWVFADLITLDEGVENLLVVE